MGQSHYFEWSIVSLRVIFSFFFHACNSFFFSHIEILLTDTNCIHLILRYNTVKWFPSSRKLTYPSSHVVPIKLFFLWTAVNFKYTKYYLTVVSMLCIRSPGNYSSYDWKFVPLTNISPFPKPYPLVTTILFSASTSLTVLDSTYGWAQVVFGLPLSGLFHFA